METIKSDNEYARIHQWLVRNYGKASTCENVECKSISPKRFEWALRKGLEYSKNRDSYIQLCPSCHRKYDFTEQIRANQSKARIGRPLYPGGMDKWVRAGIAASKKPILQFSKQGALLKEWDSISDACKALGINNAQITQCINGTGKTAGGFIWKLKINKITN